jgi:TRAP-type C4-dicarboxylate transport system permease small subunit
MIGNIIGAFIVCLVGFSLIPVISTQVNDVGLTGWSATLISFVPMLFGVGILFVSLVALVTALRGYDDYTEDYEEEYKDTPVEKKPHKQTYLEYVKERRREER